jgi:hypothetical protein
LQRLPNDSGKVKVKLNIIKVKQYIIWWCFFVLSVLAFNKHFLDYWGRVAVIAYASEKENPGSNSVRVYRLEGNHSNAVIDLIGLVCLYTG